MIEKLIEMIEKEDVQGFKSAFSQSVINAHHKELLYDLSYRKQATEIYQFMDSKTSLSQEKRVNIFIKTLQEGVKIKDFNTVSSLNDLILSQKMKDNVDHMAKSQDDDFLKKFIDAQPITSFLNFQKIIFTGFKYNHDDFIEYVSQKNLNKGHVFYCGLCAVNFKKRDAFSTLLANSMRNNPGILDDVKKLKNEYSIVMRGRVSQEEKEDFEAFINQALIETFAKHLEEELENQKPLNTIAVKPKKMKI